MRFQGRLDKILMANNAKLPQLILQEGVKVNGQLVKQYVYFLVKPDQAARLTTVAPGTMLEIEAEGLGIMAKSLDVVRV